MPKLSRLERKQAKKRAANLLPRCLAKTGSYTCQRELGHENGWNGDKHQSGGFSWTDAYAKRIVELIREWDKQGAIRLTGTGKRGSPLTIEKADSPSTPVLPEN